MNRDDQSIVVRNLYKNFGKLRALNGVDLTVQRGTTVALLGPNGSGKTTIIRILSTLLRPDKGEVTIEGHNVIRDAQKVRSLIGLTGQFAAIDEYLTGRENLRMMGRLYHLSRKDTFSRSEELLEKFDLMDAANRYVRTYSGGMRRRLDLAASLIATPPVIFLDEPTTALDPRSRLEMWIIIEELVTQGTTVFLTTQHLDEADRLADRIVVIQKGKVIAEGTSDELKKNVGSQRIHFVFVSLEDLDRATQLINDDSLLVTRKQKALSISNEHGVAKVKQLLDLFESMGIAVSGLSCSKPTLDDVFITLTGHTAPAETSPDGGQPS